MKMYFAEQLGLPLPSSSRHRNRSTSDALSKHDEAYTAPYHEDDSKGNQMHAKNHSEFNVKLENCQRPSDVQVHKRGGHTPTKKTTPMKVNSSTTSCSIPVDASKSFAYAGSKFGTSPTPKSLPPPPSHWISPKCHSAQPCHELSNHIKMLLQMV